MLKRIEKPDIKTAAALLRMLPQELIAAFTLMPLCDAPAVNGVFVQTTEDTVTAVVVAFTQVQVYVYAVPNADFEELQLFLRTFGGVVVSCLPQQTKLLGVTGFSKATLMELSAVPAGGRTAETVVEDLRPIYNLLAQEAFAAMQGGAKQEKYKDAAFQAWLSKTARGIFGGYTCVKAVYTDARRLLSAAIADSLCEFVYIRDVVTDRAFRGKGYGADCVRGICRELKTADNRIFLLCGDLQTEKFYEKCGFQKAGYIEQGIIEV